MQQNPLSETIGMRKVLKPVRPGVADALIQRGGMHTVCREQTCPNIGECFSKKQATLMILGDRCTRNCDFCHTSSGTPLPIDPDEPERVARTVMQMGLRHVVIASPARDDLRDGGARQFARTVRAIKALDPTVVVEVLIPDMRGDDAALATVAGCGADIIAHNLETVPRIYHLRSGAKYSRSLGVLARLKALKTTAQTKSGIMVGLGESIEEVLAVMHDLIDVECRILSIGQYVPPSSTHPAVAEYVDPARFDFFRREGEAMGFEHLKSSPYTQSSNNAYGYLREG